MKASKAASTAALEAVIEARTKELKLPSVGARFRNLADEVLKAQGTPVEYLAALLEAEAEDRNQRRRERRLKEARFPQIKHLQDFRFSENPEVSETTLATLARMEWVGSRESVIFIGDSGTGKTMLATCLGVIGCQAGLRVRFTTLAGLANQLMEAREEHELSRIIGRYRRFDLLIVDELGYLALPADAAELVFQVLSERNERGSLILTTNLPFGEWTKVFEDARLAKAVIDRLTHNAHIIDTGQESWRLHHGLGGGGGKEVGAD